MTNRFVYLSVVLFMAGISFAGDTDSSNLIFSDSKVYKYELDFYVDDWQKQLEDNYENGEVYMPVKFTYGNIVLDSIGVRYKGNSSFIMSSNTPKKPFKFKFDKYIDQTFFGIKKLNFSNGVKDPSFMRETIGYSISRKYMPTPRTAFVEFHIEGNYIGLYTQVEQVDKLFLSKHFEKKGYNLYKACDNGAPLKYESAEQSVYEPLYALKTNEDENDYSAFIAMIDKLNNTSDEDFVETINEHLNLDVVIRHLAINVTLSHYDSYTGSGRNYYFYDDSTSGQFWLIPWDMNECFGSYSNSWKVKTQDVLTFSNIDNRPLNKRILANDSLKQVYLRYIHELINGPAHKDSVAAMTVKIKPVIESYVTSDVNKLYSTQQFTDNIEKDISIGPMGSIPGVISFSKDRNINLKMQLDKYMITKISKEAGFTVKNQMALRNYPNPIINQTTIQYNILENKTSLHVGIYNSRGVLVKQFQNCPKKRGSWNLVWDAVNVAPGYYNIKLTSNSYSLSRSVIVLKK